MGKSTIVYKGPRSDANQIRYGVLGYHNGNPAGVTIASGNTLASGNQTQIEVSGYDSYQFALLCDGLEINTNSFNGGTNTQIILLFSANG
jgi:hypothetical protein